jgi:hypothetical protein
LFDQLEKDFSNAFIPSFKVDPPTPSVATEDKRREQEDGEKDKSVDSTDKKKDTKEDQKKQIPLFKVDMYEGETRKVNGNKFELFRLATFVTTNPLLVYEQNKPRIVRVMYELVLDKEKRKDQKEVYHLYRYETQNISNFAFEKPAQEAMLKEKDAIYTHVVANNIKEMFFRCITVKHKDDDSDKNAKSDKQKKDFQQVAFFDWGKNDQGGKQEKEPAENEKKKVPQQVEITIIFWNDNFEGTETFECSIPILSFVLDGKRPAKKKTDKKKKDDKKSDDKTDAGKK